MTPHLNAKDGEIAELVLLAGDPLRAQTAAEKYLTDYKLVSNLRNMLYFTGTYKGKKITIGGSGMGCPSIGIYSYELFKFYKVKKIIRIGSCGSYKDEIKVFDIVNAYEAVGESNYAKIATGIDSYITEPNLTLYNTIHNTALQLSKKLTPARVHSSDVFYRLDSNLMFAKKNNYDVVEMESYALFANAKFLKAQAATLLTVSDHLVSHIITTPEERQNSFTDMMEIALEAIIK